MKKILANLVIGTASLGFTVMSFAAANEPAAESKAGSYKDVVKAAAAEYKTARAKCDELKGNDKDICVAEAKAARTRTTAEAEVASKNTSSAKRKAQVDIANAEYAVAKEKCDAKDGDAKKTCIKEAKMAKEKGLLETTTQEKAGTSLETQSQGTVTKERAGTRP